MIPRHLASEIQTTFQQFKSIAITGPRQSGKTTLIRSMFSDYPYVSLENPDQREFATEDPERFLAQFSQGAVFDEVQRAPELFSWLQGVIDNSDAKFVLSGSNNFLLTESITQSLAGRVAILHLLPFSQRELPGGIGSLEQRIFAGMYPSVVADGIDPARWYRSYIQTYIERDVRLVKNIGDLQQFQRFVALLAGRVGQVLNFQALASDAGISQPTAKSWFSLLEASFLVFRMRPFLTNFRKQIVKSPKVYFWDTGVACSLLGIQQFDELVLHKSRGPLFENYCVAELHKQYLNKGVDAPLYWWRDKVGHEIDVIRSRDGMSIDEMIEFKSGWSVDSEAAKNLTYVGGLCEPHTPKRTVVYGGDTARSRRDFEQVSWRALSAE